MIIIGKHELIFDIIYFFGKQVANSAIGLATDFQQADSLAELIALIRQHPGNVLVCTQRESEMEQRLLHVGLRCDHDYFFFLSLRTAFEKKVRDLSGYAVDPNEIELLWDVYNQIHRAHHGRYMPCHHPLYEVELAENGQVYTCCSAIMPFSIGNIRHASLHDIWHSPRARLIRLTALNGTALFCSQERCDQLRTGCSREPIQHEQVSDDPLIVNIAVDATCNLSCPSCRAGYIRADADSVREKCHLLEGLRGDFYRNVRDIYVAGNGECMVSEVYQFYLVKELSHYFSGSLHLLTNGQVWNESLIQMVTDHFSPEILISVDAWSKRTYETLRSGGKHDRLIENLSRYLVLRDAEKVSSVVVRFVVQQTNYTEIPMFIDQMRELGVDRMEFTRLVNGGSFSVGNFQSASLLTQDGKLRREYFDFFRKNVWLRLGSDVVMDSAYLPVETP